MLSFAIDPEIIAADVPRGCELDFHDGETFLSIVGFQFLQTRVLGVPIPFHRNFDEVNLRFYVRRRAPEGWRRGVVFIKELAPRRAIAWVARRFYEENYVTLPVRSEIELSPPSGTSRVAYTWRRAGRQEHVAATFTGPATEPAGDPDEPADLATFITEHYWGYSARASGETVEYRVEHPRWRTWPALTAEVTCDVEQLYGGRFTPALGRSPDNALVADGSPVTVRRGIALG